MSVCLDEWSPKYVNVDIVLSFAQGTMKDK